jgi:uncharacterized membrane protein
MEVFLGDWVNLLLRWAHLIVGIGWIGTSFYFVGLDYSLRKRDRMNVGVMGTAWQVHGGGFYHVEKFVVAPTDLPEDLQWFRWEAYLTFLTGFGLLLIQYYLHANAYLIDPAVMPLSPGGAVAISIASLVGGWLIYDGLCRALGDRTVPLAIAVFALILIASYLFTNVFSARGAFLHVGAFVGTIMAVNVFMVIVPNQRIMTEQLMRGEKPDARLGIVGKQRSLHNNYLTLPVLVMMVSPHYPFLSGNKAPWLVVAMIIIAGALIRHFFNRHEAGDEWHGYGWASLVALFAICVAIYVTAPSAPSTSAGGVTDAEALALTKKHCSMCHAAKPTHESFQEAPKSVMLETVDEIKKYAPLMITQLQNKAMPLGNQTAMTDDERARLIAYAAGLK